MELMLLFILWLSVTLVPFSANSVAVSKLFDYCSKCLRFLLNILLPLEGDHYIELTLLTDDCDSHKVHFNIKITYINNDVS